MSGTILKSIIIILMFGIISIIVTSLLIMQKLSNNSGTDVTYSGEYISTKNEKENLPIEKTLDLYGTYYENNISVMEVRKENLHGVLFPVIEISGLKNKEVQKKINDTIYNKAIEEFNEIYNPTATYDNFDIYAQEDFNSNFSNVISFDYSFNYTIAGSNDDDQEYYYSYLPMNFELVNGTELKLQDLFTKDTDIKNIISIAVSKRIEKLKKEGIYDFETDEYYRYGEPYFDHDKQMWMQERITNTYAGETKEVVEYIPRFTEQEIIKRVNKVYNKNDINFYFNKNGFFIEIGEDDGWSSFERLYFADFADNVVIYDKYITKDSLYEDENSHLAFLACSTDNSKGYYKDVNFKGNNFFYDVILMNSQYPYENDIKDFSSYKGLDYVNSKREDLLNSTLKKIEEDKKIASENPSEAYFLYISSYVTPCKYEYVGEFLNAVLESNNICVFKCKIEDKEKVLDQLFKAYRYPNIAFYGSVMDNVESSLDFWFDSSDYPYKDVYKEYVEKTRTNKLYNVIDGTEFKDIKDIFKDPNNYEVSIRKAYNTKEMRKGFDNTNWRYEFNPMSIELFDKNSNDPYSYISINYNEMKDDLVFVPYSTQILNSSRHAYSFYEIQEMDLETLNKAYNEIFARYGHDFKNKELKEYFSQFDWYKPIPDKVVTMDELNIIEKDNVNTIKEVIDEKKSESSNNE